MTRRIFLNSPQPAGDPPCLPDAGFEALGPRTALSDPTPASLFVIAAHLDNQDWAGMQHAFRSQSKNIGKPYEREAIANAAGFDGAALIRRQSDKDVQSRWSTDRAHARQRFFRLPDLSP
jgi:hypothetical protein